MCPQLSLYAFSWLSVSWFECPSPCFPSLLQNKQDFLKQGRVVTQKVAGTSKKKKKLKTSHSRKWRNNRHTESKIDFQTQSSSETRTDDDDFERIQVEKSYIFF